MHYFMLLICAIAFGQSSKTLDVPNEEILSKEQRMELERYREQKIREEWDKKEQQAQRMEEVERVRDERKAEMDDVN